MLEALNILETEETPAILLDQQSGNLKFSGRSIPENADFFYSTIINWILQYFKEPNTFTQIEMKFEYFNSASAKNIMEILVLFDKFYKDGNNIKITWFYEHNDDIMQEKGLDIIEVLNLPVEVKTC